MKMINFLKQITKNHDLSEQMIFRPLFKHIICLKMPKSYVLTFIIIFLNQTSKKSQNHRFYLIRIQTGLFEGNDILKIRILKVLVVLQNWSLRLKKLRIQIQEIQQSTQNHTDTHYFICAFPQIHLKQKSRMLIFGLYAQLNFSLQSYFRQYPMNKIRHHSIHKIYIFLLAIMIFQVQSRDLEQNSETNFDGSNLLQKRVLQVGPSCSVIGCQACSSTNYCSNCVDDYWTNLINGECVCKLFYEKPNIIGECQACYAKGCASCELNSDHQCRICIDPLATIVDGECICPPGHSYMNEQGLCHACDAVGCHACTPGSNSHCCDCIDDTAILTYDGFCNCPGSFRFPNAFGLCSYCLVQGCISCTWSAYVCHRCLDPLATLTDYGKCECPANMPMNLQGYCQSCNVSNCHQCAIGNQNICEICDPTFTRTPTCTCECLPGQREDNGTCVDCQLPYCRACETFPVSQEYCIDCESHVNNNTIVLHDGECHQCHWIGCEICQTPTTCQTCVDPDTIIIDGQCYCSIYYQKLSSENQICEDCYVVGCRECVPIPFGCYYSTQCKSCIDPRSDLINDICICPPGQYMSGSGYCIPCRAAGCKTCSSPNMCIQCVDPNATLVNGQCLCGDKCLLPNNFGICAKCFVEGCASCVLFQPHTCHQCLDPAANLVHGKCHCSQHRPMNWDGLCQLCNVDFCVSCHTEYPDVCEQCFETFLKVNGKCVCKSGKRAFHASNEDNVNCTQSSNYTNYFNYSHGFNNNTNSSNCIPYQCIPCEQPCLQCYSNVDFTQICTKCDLFFVLEHGECFPCQIVGCIQCVTQEICLECADPDSTTLVDGQCVCNAYFQKPSENGNCSECYTPGCVSCLNNTDSFCFQCKDSVAFKENNVCYCPTGLYLNGEGLCHSCQVPGCATCSPTSDQECIQCIDSYNTTIINGQCICSRSVFQKPNSFGKCNYCLVEGCASCLFNSYTCYKCIDDANTQLQNGQCRCKGSGKSFNHQGKCEACSVAKPGCATCSSNFPYDCLSCVSINPFGLHSNSIVDGQCVCDHLYYKANQQNGVCTQCLVPGCSSCSYASNPNRCSICIDPRTTILNNLCACPPDEYIFGGDGYCRSCRVAGCTTCSSLGEEICVVCNPDEPDLLLNQESQCVCPLATQKPNSFGQCETCNVVNCLSCEANNPSKCFVCQNKDAIFDDGLGRCLDPVQKEDNQIVSDPSLSTGEIVGIVLGSLLVLGLISLAVWKFKFSKKTEQKSDLNENREKVNTESTINQDHESTNGENKIFRSHLNLQAERKLKGQPPSHGNKKSSLKAESSTTMNINNDL